MTITAVKNAPSSVRSEVNGRHFDDAASPAAFVANLGFDPVYIRFENFTDRIALEWFEGMAANTSLRTVAAGTRTTSTGITVAAGVVTVAAAEILQNKQYHWFAR